MKKILSFALIFVLSLSVYSTFDIKAEATEDVTINLHIYQYDGDYTNTGTGLYDSGLNGWLGWNAKTETDDFGAVYTKTFTAAEINVAADELEFKPTRNTTEDDPVNYLAPASTEGKVMLDVTALKAGTKTSLDVYYVEGSKAFYISEQGNGLFMNVFANTEVAADATVYDDWGMHTWDNGAGGSHPEWVTPVIYQIDMELQVGEYLVPMKLGIVEVSVGASATTGFIAHKGDTKSCPTNMDYDGAALIDEENGNKAQVVLYEKGNCEFTADYSTFLTNVEVSYKDNLKNKFMDGSILSPESLTVTMLTPKSLFDLSIDRFTVTDSTITSIDYGTNPAFAPVDTDVEIEFQTYVRVYVDTDLPNVALVGAFQNWDIANTVEPVGTHLGYQVFEISTNVMDFAFAVVAHDRTDDVATTEVNEATFSWGDKISGENNLEIELTPGAVSHSVFIDETDMYYHLDALEASMIDVADYTYTSAVTCTAGTNLLTFVLSTDLPTTDLTMFGLVGTPQKSGYDATLNDGEGGWTNGDWNPGAAINPTGLDADGNLVFEVCVETLGMDLTSGTEDDELHQEFKVLYNDGVDDVETLDTDESGFNWGDTELTPQVVFDFAAEAEATMALSFDATIVTTDFDAYEATIEVSNTYRYTIYLNPGDLDAADFGVVGNVQPTPWDISNPLLFTMEDGAGNYYIDLAINNKDVDYLIVYNALEDDPLTLEVDESAWDWSQKISGNDNLVAGLGDLSFKADMISYAMVEEVMTFEKVSLMDAMTNTMTLMFADDSFVYGTDYTVSYIESYGVGEIEDTVISLEALGFTLSNDFVVGDDIAQTGTYALLPTELAVIFAHPIDITVDMGVELLDSEGTVIAIDSIDRMYTMGTYTPTVTTCPAGHEMLTVYLQTNDMITDLTTVGLVGTPQQSGWDATLKDGEGDWTVGGWNPSEAINPVGIDSNGNLVFEICIETLGKDLTADTEDDVLHQEFKVLYSGVDDVDTVDVDESEFAWGDKELTAQIVFDLDGPKVMFLEEGKLEGHTEAFIYNLAEENKLMPTGSYMLKYIDANGFIISYDVIVDDEAPAIDAAQKTGMALEVDNDSTFNLMSYFNVLRFVDNYDGPIGYTIESTIDLTVNGAQNVVISATDAWGNKSTETFVFTVIDVINPVVTLDASPTFEAGATEPNWNDYVTVEGGTLVINDTQVDMANAGEFYVAFTATDEAGNTVTENLKVTITAVVEPEPEPETGCFGSVGVGAALVAVLSVIGTAAFVVVRKR
jgi:hypothetical protein